MSQFNELAVKLGEAHRVGAKIDGIDLEYNVLFLKVRDEVYSVEGFTSEELIYLNSQIGKRLIEVIGTII